MNTETLERIRELRSAQKSLATFWERYLEATKRPNIDKYDAKFCGDERFSCFSRKIYFSAYTGAYGSSTCGTFGAGGGASASTLGNLLVKALNSLKEEIFTQMALHAAEEAEELVGKAKEELQELTTLLGDVDHAD